MTDRLHELAKYHDPKQTLIYIPGWDGYYDHNQPEHKLDPKMGGLDGWLSMIKVAHDYGFKIIAHYDPIHVGYTTAEYWKVRDWTYRRDPWDIQSRLFPSAEGLRVLPQERKSKRV